MEIEIKARLKEGKSVMQRLTNLGCEFSDPIMQDDRVWAKECSSMEAFLNNPVFLRIRIENGGKAILTAKKSKQQSGQESLVKREHGVVIDSVEEARGILEMLGLREVVRTIKKRTTTKHRDFEICFDDVDGLGMFIELEKIADEADAPRIQREMKALLTELGVTEDDYVHKGYDILMLETLSSNGQAAIT